MENAVATLCCRPAKSHKEMERLLGSKITDYIRKQYNHKGHLRAHGWMPFWKMFPVSAIHLQFASPDQFPKARHFLSSCIFKDTVGYMKKRLYTLMCVPCVASPWSLSSPIAIEHTAASLNVRRRVVLRAVCLFMCEDVWMREMPGTFQHVFIRANSSSGVPQLWWAGG